MCEDDDLELPAPAIEDAHNEVKDEKEPRDAGALHPSWQQNLAAYGRDIHSLYALFGKGAMLAPPIGSLILYLGPPWPAHMAVVTVTLIAEILVTLHVFARAQDMDQMQHLNRAAFRALWATGAFFVLFVALFAFFVRDMPDASSRDTTGLRYTDAARRVIHIPDFTETQALNGAGNDPTVIWLPWTVYMMRIALLISWLCAFCSLSAYFAWFTTSQQRRQQQRTLAR